jgi:hypothetical protein
MPQTELKSLGQIFKESAQAVRRNLSLFIFLNTITILGTAWDIGSDIGGKSSNYSWGQNFIHSFSNTGSGAKMSTWLILLLLLAGIFLYLILEVVAVLAARHQNVKFSEAWEVFRTKWWKIILAELLFFIIVGVGLIALIVPGLYLLSRLAIWPLIVIDQDVSIAQALNRSWELTKGRAWIVFTTAFLALILSLPSLIPVIGPIIATILTIAYSVALPIRYFELKREKN